MTSSKMKSFKIFSLLYCCILWILPSKASSSWIIADKAWEKYFKSNSNEIWLPKGNWTEPDEFLVNALYNQEPGNSSVTHYRFNLSSIDGVGLTTKKYFRPGYGLKGFGYNSVGNVVDAYGSLIGKFGPGWTESTRIDMIAQKKSDRFQIYIVQDGRPLGLAFDLKFPITDKLYPYVRFSSPGKASVGVSQLEQVPKNFTNRIPQTYHGIHGRWELTEYGRNKPLMFTMATILKTSEGELFLSLSLINTMYVTLMRQSDGKHYKLEGEMVTEIGIDDEINREENRIFGMFEGLIAIDLVNQDSLLITTFSGELKFKRFPDQAPEPWTSNPLE